MKYVYQVSFFLVLTSRTCFRINDLKENYTHTKLRLPLLYELFTKAENISTLVEPNQRKLGFVITTNKASYFAQEDSICLFSVAREGAMNKH